MVHSAATSTITMYAHSLKLEEGEVPTPWCPNEADTEYVALCDGDDFWTNDNKLQMQVDFLDSHKDYTICFHQTKIYFEDNSEPPVYYPLEMESDFDFQKYLKGNMLVANAVVYRWLFRKKDSFIKFFPKDVIPGDFYVHLAHAKEGKTHYINKPMSIYRRQPNGMWYGTSKPEFKTKFYLRDGEKLLNFYDEVDKNLGIDDDVFGEIKDYLIKDILDVAFRENEEKLLSIVFDRYYKDKTYIFNEYMFLLNNKDSEKFKSIVEKNVK